MKSKLQAAAFAVGLLLLLVVSFGLLIPWLGFYWDDWPVLLTSKLRGAAGFWEFYTYDRPFSAWTYVVMMPLLGNNAQAWQVTTLVLRWLTAVAMGWSLWGLWPDRRREVTLAAFLFAVYPVYTQQSISVAYSQHWICYLLYFFSLGAMTWAWRLQESRRLGLAAALTAAGAVAALVGIMTMEYFAGLELLRPLVLWLMAGQSRGRVGVKPKLRSVLLHWLPYLVVLAAFVIWRIFFVQLAGTEPNTPTLLFRLAGAPLQTLIQLGGMALQDIVYVLVTVWGDLLSVEVLQRTDGFVLFTWAISLLVAAAIFLGFRWLKETAHASEDGRAPADGRASEDGGEPVDGQLAEGKKTNPWLLEALGLGAAGLVLGSLPVWFTDHQMINGFYSNRFGMAAMLGASLVVVGAICWLTPSWTRRAALVAILVGLSVGMHLRTANDYRWSWVKQSRFYWQLAWRAPSILPHTAIFSDGEIFPYVGLYSTASGINLLYPPVTSLPQNELPYYFYSLGRQFAHEMPLFNQGLPLENPGFRMYQFQGNTRDGLVIFYEPTINNCLHVLSPQDASAPDLPDVTVKALANSHPERISGMTAPGYPPEDIFGPEPEHGWCYLYQKAELARQLGDWQGVVDLGRKAEEKGYTIWNSESSTAFEWLPFIEGYARTGLMEQALNLTRDAVQRKPEIAKRMCVLWQGLPQGPEVEGIMGELGCQ